MTPEQQVAMNLIEKMKKILCDLKDPKITKIEIGGTYFSRSTVEIDLGSGASMSISFYEERK